jgi:hypothetical protein
VIVEIDAPDEFDAADKAWEIAESYVQTLRPMGDARITSVDATFDGIGAHTVKEVD